MTGKLQALLKLSLLGLVSVLLVGCGEGLGDLRQFVDQVRAKPPGRIEPIPEFTPYQNFEYTSHDLRDPFKLVDFRRPEEVPEEIAQLGSGLRPDIDRVKEPLEDFPLDTLRLKGTIDDKDGVKWGLIFAPDNTIHRVIEGNYMGQNHGRIITVTDQKIELTEIVPDGLGNYIERSSAVALIE
ncbi:MAG: pilus assembly protein PilP [Gammaproteobacteria bacterium]|nr:pilus assembly protein PilP [Gammaproteobacteria bacterium]MDH3537631.1 pilus assembly protein PilP [Gammaproteobacteria bacterium]